MLERETEIIKQIIAESTIGERNAIKLNEVVAADLPSGVKAYIIADVTKHFEKELQQTAFERIAKGVASTITGQRAIMRTLAMEFTLSREGYIKVVEDTVFFLENYLCRPRWTLQQLMFEQGQTITFDEMIKKLELAVEYSYFALLIERHARRAGWRLISAQQFASLVERIDTEVVKNHSPRELALLTKPIFDFLLFGDTSMDRPVPIGAILLFFEDKKMVQEKEHIERMYQLKPHKQISLNQLIAMLEEFHAMSTAVKADVEQAEKELLAPLEAKHAELHQPSAASDEVPAEGVDSAERIAEEPEREATTLETAEHEIPHDPVVEHIVEASRVDILSTEREQRSDSLDALPDAVDAMFIEASANEPTTNDVAQPEPTTSEQDVPPSMGQQPTVVNPQVLTEYAQERARLSAAIMNFPDTPAKQIRPELLDVEDAFSSEQRAKFIRRVFKSNEADYVVFINSVNKANTWREAQVHLRQLYEINNLDVRSPDIVEFTDAMHARFNPAVKTE
jgi:hypothetical protein